MSALVDQAFRIAWQNACSDAWSGDQTGWLFERRVMRALEATAEMVAVDALWRLDGINLQGLAVAIGFEIKRQDKRRVEFSEMGARDCCDAGLARAHIYEVVDDSFSDAMVADWMIAACSRRKQAEG